MVVVVGGGAVVVVVVVVVGGGAVVVVVVVVTVVGVASTRGEAATCGVAFGAGCSMTGFKVAAKEAAATRAERDAGRASTVVVSASGVGSSADTAAKPSRAIRTTMITPAAEI